MSKFDFKKLYEKGKARLLDFVKIATKYIKEFSIYFINKIYKPGKVYFINKIYKPGKKIFLEKIYQPSKTYFLSLSIRYRSSLISLIILGIILIIFIFSGTNIWGYLITIIAFVVSIYMQLVYVKKDLMKAAMLIILPALVATSIYNWTTPDKEINNKDVKTDSSVVSQGVNLDDLGNILNGQYFFDDGIDQIYSTFDESGNTHIYIKNKKSGDIKTIFDGFGWSFVVRDSWIYFSGNSGSAIDGTYNIFRMRKDGSSLERLNYNYSYNMNFYKEWLYYERQADEDSSTASVYRSNVDGTNEVELVTNTLGLSIVYENKLYYLADTNDLYVANPDGTNPKVVLNEKISNFIIGQGKIIYVDNAGNIKYANIDGTNIKLVKASLSGNVARINSYKNNIYYVIYEDTYLSDSRAYPYHIYSIKFDGTGDKKIYDGVSWGYYVNVLNDKVFVLDYANDTNLNKFVAIARNMNLDGTNINNLSR